jgi:hypothetical protein
MLCCAAARRLAAMLPAGGAVSMKGAAENLSGGQAEKTVGECAAKQQ